LNNVTKETSLFFTDGNASYGGVLSHQSVYPSSIQGGECNALNSLIDASVQRLALAREVAFVKWDDGAPVEDVTREQQVIDAAITAGREVELPAEFVRRFFSAQIEANKLIQYALLTKWQAEGEAPGHSGIDLAQTVRPQIDRIQAVLISALVNRTSSPSRASCRAQLAEAIRGREITYPEISKCLFSIALIRALGPLCDATDEL
jgi:chorismate mutase